MYTWLNSFLGIVFACFTIAYKTITFLTFLMECKDMRKAQPGCAN